MVRAKLKFFFQVTCIGLRCRFFVCSILVRVIVSEFVSLMLIMRIMFLKNYLT